MPEFLDAHESALLEHVLSLVEPHARELLCHRLRVLEQTSALMNAMPSLRRTGALAGVTRDESTLLDHLCEITRYGGELCLPVKGTLARTYVVTKVQMLKAFRLALPAASDPTLVRGLTDEVSQSVFTLLAEELLRTLLYDHSLPTELRRRAAQTLVTLWDSAVLVEIDDFCPVLELAWDARCWAGSAALGTMVGTVEYFRLVQQNCPEAVLAFFSRNELPEEESQAFQEFLLGLPWDDVVRLRACMKAEGRTAIDSSYAASRLSVTLTQVGTKGDPEALYASFRRRLHHAEYRRATDQPGPVRTAEGYLMIHLLGSEPA